MNITDSTVHKLGRALKKHGFLRLKKKGIYVYAVLEKSFDEVENENKESDVAKHFIQKKHNLLSVSKINFL